MYWRIQLRPSPNNPRTYAAHAAMSLSAGFIGLTPEEDAERDLCVEPPVQPESHPAERPRYNFVERMQVGDVVMVMCNDYPFALVEVSGRCNCINQTQPARGLYYKYFRPVTQIRYYADYLQRQGQNDKILTLSTLATVVDESSQPYRFIEKWLEEVPDVYQREEGA